MGINLSKEKTLLIILMVMSAFMFFYNIQAPSYFETDEVIYSQVAREIVRSGDWVTLHLFGKPWFIHPPLYMWLTAASSYIFGDNEFNTRLWNALFALGLIYITYLLGKKLFKDGVGILAAYILATGLQYIIQARMAIFDIPYIFFMLLGTYLLLCYFDDKKLRNYYLAFVMFGLSMLMKGPVGLFLPMIVLTPYLFFIKELKKLYNLHLIPGLFITALIGGSWYAAGLIIYGRIFYESVIQFYLIGRFTTTIESHYAPMYFYIIIVIFGFLPWSPFLIFSSYYQGRKRGDNSNLFSIIWMAIVFLFFTVARTKLPGYILSLYPIASISVAKLMLDHISGEDAGLEEIMQKAYKALVVFSVLLVCIGLAFRVFESPDGLERMFFDLNITFLMLGIGGLLAASAYFKDKYSIKPVQILVVTMVVFSFITAKMTMVDLDQFKPMKAVSMRINSEYMSTDRIIGYNILYKGSFQHYMDKPVIWLRNIYELRDEVKKPGRYFLITSDNDFSGFGKDLDKSLFFVFQYGNMVILSNQK